jgi:hypothetical protein
VRITKKILVEKIAESLPIIEKQIMWNVCSLGESTHNVETCTACKARTAFAEVKALIDHEIQRQKLSGVA